MVGSYRGTSNIFSRAFRDEAESALAARGGTAGRSRFSRLDSVQPPAERDGSPPPSDATQFFPQRHRLFVEPDVVDQLILEP
jgi:hypothetical protein